MTPVFLKLAKIRHLTHTLDEIHDNDSNPFPDTKSQNKYIYDYFKNIYKKNNNLEPEMSIEEFLGPEVLANPHVTAAKIPQDKRMAFEQQLTLIDFDKSLAECSPNTAPGTDGISYAFL